MGDRRLDKTEVDYHNALGGVQRCSNCSMFKRNPHYRDGFGQCELVKGSISPYAVCDRWESA